MNTRLLLSFLLNFVSIVRFNFHYFPFMQAIKFPVFLKNAKLRVLKGTVKIESTSIKPGMIKLGFPNSCMVTHKGFSWLNRGGVIFKGKFKVGNDSVIETTSDAKLIIGDNVSFNGSFHLTCSNNITIGNNVLGSWNISIFDTDFHRMIDINTSKKLTSCSSSVIIGDNCWLCMGGTILKGAKLGDYCTLGAESLLASDLGKEKYVVVAGHPAKIIKRGIYLNVFDCSPEWHY